MGEQRTLDEAEINRFWSNTPGDWKLLKETKVYEVNPDSKPEVEPNTCIEIDGPIEDSQNPDNLLDKILTRMLERDSSTTRAALKGTELARLAKEVRSNE